MLADILLALDVSDDDVELAEIARQCGYDFKHPMVCDVAEPQLAEWHGEPCLLFRLSLCEALPTSALEALLQSGTLGFSHPSVACVRLLGIRPAA